MDEVGSLFNTIDEYGDLLENLSVVECGKHYIELDEQHKAWLNQFVFYDNYFLWRKTRPMSSPQEVGNAFRKLFNAMSK